MLPRHLPVYSREIAARAFHVALYLDTFTFCKFGGNTMPVPFCFPIGECEWLGLARAAISHRL
jgi:hypothetical protein